MPPQEEAEDEEFRKQLRAAYMKCARICPDRALAFVCVTLSSLEQPLAALPFFEVECALRFVFHFSEGVGSAHQSLVTTDPFRGLVVALHQSDITQHPHAHVLSLYYELAVRYIKLVRDEPAALRAVLEAMCGSRGLQHTSPMLRSRACYFLLRMIKVMGPSLGGYVESIVARVQGLMHADPAVTGLCESDSLQLFETMGSLVGLSSIPPVQQGAFLDVVLSPHLVHIEETMRVQAAAAGRAPPLPPVDGCGEQIALSIAAVANVCKGFTRTRTELQPIFTRVAQAALAVLTGFPAEPTVRSKTVFLVHRLIVCLGQALFPFLQPMLDPLMRHCDSKDLLEVVQLANQLCISFQDRMITVLDPCLVPFLGRFFELMPALSSSNGRGRELIAPHEEIERASVQV